MNLQTGIREFSAATFDRRLSWFTYLLRIPSVSATAAHASDCRRAADAVGRELSRVGMEHVEVSETGGHPVVYGDWLHADGAATVLLYTHYDVQPADPVELWSSPPFEPVVDGHIIRARGAADDKGHIHIHLGAIEALLATRTLRVNVRFIVEGEEEIGSPHLSTWLEANQHRLQADVAVVSDSAFFEDGRPALTTGFRGFSYAQIDVHGAPIDLHSGFYGGAIDNPARVLASVLASMNDANGRVLIPGFYDDVRELGTEERLALASIPFDDEAYRLGSGVAALHGELGYNTLERRGDRPCLDISGMWSGFQGEGSKAIIPADAHAKVGCRLVPNQDPSVIHRQLRDFVLSSVPGTVTVEVHDLGGGRPYRAPMDHPANRAAARVLEATFGVPPALIRSGGTVPACGSFESILGLPMVLLGFMPANSRIHATDEWMDLRTCETGILALAALLSEFRELIPSHRTA